MRSLAVVLLLVQSPLALALSPRIAFERVMPAAHDLGGEDVAIVSAPANDPKADPFVERFVETANRSGMLRLRDARAGTGPADVHLDVKSITCDTAVREGEGGTHDADGKRVVRRYFTAETVCLARIDVLSKVMKYRSTFYAKGAGTSPRAEEIGEEERARALEGAIRHMALDAADRITPRRVRESIALEEDAPAFEEGMSLIDAARFAEARALWEAELKKAPRNAALHYNLGAVCEAMRDRRAAEQHYKAARQLAPEERRYATELQLFSKRIP
jgi:hypothetical protein